VWLLNDQVNFFQKDFDSAIQSAWNVDTSVKSASAQAAGEDYNTITSLAVRQAFGALELVGTQDKTYMFMKEISSIPSS
jgi:hypothetical protein